MFRLLVISTIILLGVSDLPNYQERAIYLGEKDNVCRFGEVSDSVYLRVNLDGMVTRTFNISGATSCSDGYFRYAKQITPMTGWLHCSRGCVDEEIYFSDTTKRVFYGGELFKMIQKTVVVNPVKIGGLLYDCTILGDGNIQHFGI